MKVLRLGFVGVRTAEVDGMTSFFRDVLGLEAGGDRPDWTISQLPTGRFDFAEVYGLEFDDRRLVPSEPGVFVAFVVDDLEQAHAEATAAGLETGELVWAAEAFDNAEYAGLGWFFVRAPDGNLYVLQQTPG